MLSSGTLAQSLMIPDAPALSRLIEVQLANLSASVIARTTLSAKEPKSSFPGTALTFRVLVSRATGIVDTFGGVSEQTQRSC